MPHSCVGSALAEGRERFPTLSRVAFTSASMARGWRVLRVIASTLEYTPLGLNKFVSHFGWRQVAVVCGETLTTGLTYYACQGAQTLFEEDGIRVCGGIAFPSIHALLKINQFATWNETSSDAEIDAILEETKRTARILIVPTKEACVGAELALLKRAKALGMFNGSFV